MGLYEEADKSLAYLVRSVNNQYAGFSRLTPVGHRTADLAGCVARAARGPAAAGRARWASPGGGAPA